MSQKNGKIHTMHKQRRRRLLSRVRARGYDLKEVTDKVSKLVKEKM